MWEERSWRRKNNNESFQQSQDASKELLCITFVYYLSIYVFIVEIMITQQPTMSRWKVTEWSYVVLVNNVLFYLEPVSLANKKSHQDNLHANLFIRSLPQTLELRSCCFALW